MFIVRNPLRLAAVLSLALFAPLASGNVFAGSLRIGNIIPNAGPIDVHVTSMRAMRFADMVPQHVDYSCGAAALATILKYGYDKNVTEFDVLKGLFKVSDVEVVRKKGFSLLDLKHYVETLGYRGRGYKISDATLDHIKMPVIVLLDIKGYKHFVVFKKAVGDRVYIGDPALGNRVMSLDDFLHSWQNQIIFAVIGKGFDPNTALLNPPPPLSANNLVNVRAIPQATLAGFGLQRAEQF